MNLYSVIEEFKKITNSDEKALEIEVLKAPHQSFNLPKGNQAIYIFEKDGIFFKIGKVGEKTNNRFRYQHYKPNSNGSTLAKSILNNRENKSLREVFNSEILNSLSDENIESFIKQNMNRINIYMDISLGEFYLNLLEALLHYRLNPVFEGKI